MEKIFYLFNHKTFFIPTWNKTFHKNVFVFRYSDMITVGSSLLFFLLKSIYVLDFTPTSLILIVLWCVLLHLSTMSSNLLIYTFFWYRSQQQYIFFSYVLNAFLYHYPAAMISFIYYKNYYICLFVSSLVCD